MIFIIGGGAILIISFIVALISLVREQKGQQIPEEILPSVMIDNSEKNAEEFVGNTNHVDVDTQLSEEEIKSANREEAYRILQSRVQKLSEAETNGDKSNSFDNTLSDKNQNSIDSSLIEDPETNIEDPLEADIAASEKVPFPWEEKKSSNIADIQIQETTNRSKNVVSSDFKPTSDSIDDESKKQNTSSNKQSFSANKQDTSSNKLSGQINLGDLKKNDE